MRITTWTLNNIKALDMHNEMFNKNKNKKKKRRKAQFRWPLKGLFFSAIIESRPCIDK